MSTEVRSSVRIDLAGNLKEGMDASVKSITNAEQAARKLNDTLKNAPASPGGPGSPNAPAGPGGVPVYDKRILQAEMAARMSSVELERHLAQQAAQQRLDTQRREAASRNAASQQARQTLAMQGLALSGMGGIGGAYGQGLAIGSALDSAGFKGLGRAAGPAGLAIGAAAMTADTMRKYEPFNPLAINADPYLDAQTRGRGMLKALPFGETAMGYYDTFSGRTAGFARNQEAQDRLRTRLGQETRVSDVMGDVRRQMAAGTAERMAPMQFQIAGHQSFDRSTGVGQRQQAEFNALVEPRKQAVQAERELFKAQKDREFLERKSVELAEQRRVATIDVKLNTEQTAKIEQQHSAHVMAEMKKGPLSTRSILGGMIAGPLGFQIGMTSAFAGIGGGDTGVAMNQSRGQTIESQKRLDDIRGQEMQNVRDIAAAKQKEARAAFNRDQANIAIQRAELGNLQAREQFATGSARGIGGMGIGGRQQGLAALQAIQQMGGVENATPELIAAAESVAPDAIGKMREAAGKKMLGGEFGEQLKAAGATELDLAGGQLDKLRKEVDKKAEGIPAAEQKADVNLGAALEAGSAALQGIEKLLGEELPAMLERLKLNLSQMRNSL